MVAAANPKVSHSVDRLDRRTCSSSVGASHSTEALRPTGAIPAYCAGFALPQQVTKRQSCRDLLSRQACRLSICEKPIENTNHQEAIVAQVPAAVFVRSVGGGFGRPGRILRPAPISRSRHADGAHRP
jgi:hypothetical protein